MRALRPRLLRSPCHAQTHVAFGRPLWHNGVHNRMRTTAAFHRGHHCEQIRCRAEAPSLLVGLLKLVCACMGVQQCESPLPMVACPSCSVNRQTHAISGLLKSRGRSARTAKQQPHPRPLSSLERGEEQRRAASGRLVQCSCFAPQTGEGPGVRSLVCAPPTTFEKPCTRLLTSAG